MVWQGFEKDNIYRCSAWMEDTRQVARLSIARASTTIVILRRVPLAALVDILKILRPLQAKLSRSHPHFQHRLRGGSNIQDIKTHEECGEENFKALHITNLHLPDGYNLRLFKKQSPDRLRVRVGTLRSCTTDHLWQLRTLVKQENRGEYVSSCVIIHPANSETRATLFFK